MKVLLISSYYPPVPYISVQGIYKKIRVFIEEGHKVTLLRPFGHQSYTLDHSLLSYFSENIPEIKIFSFTLSGIKILFSMGKYEGVRINKDWLSDDDSFFKKIKAIVKKYFVIPDEYFLFPWISLFCSPFLGLKEYDIIMVRCPDPSMMISGLLLSKIYKKRLIVDYYDPWFGSAKFDTFPLFRKKLEFLIEKKILEHANAILTSSNGHREFLIKKYSIKSEKVFFIHGVVDKNDFININNVQNQKLKVTYVGSTADTIYNYKDKISIIPFLYGLIISINNQSIKRSEIEIVIVGHLSQKVLRHISYLGLSDIVTYVGYKSHLESIKEMMKSDILLHIFFDHTESLIRINYKIFEYLWARKPILSLCNKGEVKEIIEKLEIGICCNPSDFIEIAESISHMMLLKKNNLLQNSFCKNQNLDWCEIESQKIKIKNILNYINEENRN